MTSNHTVQHARPEHTETIKAIAVASGLFAQDEVEFFDPMLAGFFDGSMEGHEWLVLTDETQQVIASAYFAPEPYADRMWNLYFIATNPAAQGSGAGTALLTHIEQTLRARGTDHARTLIVETSSTDQYARTRDFYRKQGFTQEATIRQFYGPEDHKVVFWKSLLA